MSFSFWGEFEYDLFDYQRRDSLIILALLSPANIAECSTSNHDNHAQTNAISLSLLRVTNRKELRMLMFIVYFALYLIDSRQNLF